jgi:hypothetical protein
MKSIKVGKREKENELKIKTRLNDLVIRGGQGGKRDERVRESFKKKVLVLIKHIHLPFHLGSD